MTNDIKLDLCCVISPKLYNIRKFAILRGIYFTIDKFPILRGIYFTIATFAKVRLQKRYSRIRYSQFNRVTLIPSNTTTVIFVILFDVDCWQSYCKCLALILDYGIVVTPLGTIDRDNLAQVARINFYRLELSSSLQNISKNVFG